MDKISLLILVLFYWPNLVSAAVDIDAAVQDFCKCGFPPSSRCMADLAKKYPEINSNSALQNRVMRESQTECRKDSKASENSVRDMVGNKNLDLSTLPTGVAGALVGINKVVGATGDCSTASFKVTIPNNWQCRKQHKNAHDVTLYTDGNRLNVTVGKNQGMTSCSLIPICTSEDYLLSNKFDSKLYKNPMAGSYEYAGSYKNDNLYKLTITSNAKPSKAQLTEIGMILDSFEKH